MKRIFDIFISSSALFLLLPIILIVAFLVKVKLGGPIIFRQTRPGYKGELFEILKFRTMLDSTDENGKLLDNNLRMTSFGLVLRSTSLDELPGLWNVFKGDMSLVGPRPLLPEYLPLYSKEQSHRHDVRPGITGWAQVNGRNAISWKEKFELDIWYVNNKSFYIDMKILLLTIKKVILRNDINSSETVTMEKFSGNNE
ncbi:sugar transferase [Photobacterium sanguinicancri]|uniref:Sugar transferase n=1 Tax=Photobacterium sanguinicancri TaxID=875932 RepID=A0AAW7Y291_9GAMM|nr:sugar transferase [Photobacterium sanguinicancri]MDO6542476.1 sugar transferase [Photobacterium sanguinicancri]